MDCPICNGELRVNNKTEDSSSSVYQHQCCCTRCRRYAREVVGCGNTIWIGKFELYGTHSEIEKGTRYKRILFCEKTKYKMKKFFKKVLKNY